MSKVKWAAGCVLVCGIHPNSANVLKKLQNYFENPQTSGGGPIAENGICITDSEREAVVQFRNERDAVSVLKRKNHLFDGETIEVLQCPLIIHKKYMKGKPSNLSDKGSATAKDPELTYKPIDSYKSPVRPDEQRQQTELIGATGLKQNDLEIMEEDRTVLVEGLTPDINIDVVELFFENVKKSGGGLIESIDHEENSTTALLVFEDVQAAENILLKKTHTIAGKVIQTKKKPKKSTILIQPQEANDEAIVLKISDISPHESEELLVLFLEHRRKSGGGPIDKIELDSDRRSATVIYQNNDDAERVLANETLVFNGNSMHVQRVQKCMWDGKTVFISGFNNISEEVLELMYENKNKSGGGPIDSIIMQKDRKGAMITFENEKDAAQVLHQGIVKTKDGTIFKAIKPVQDDADATEGAIVLSKSVMVLGLDESINEEILEMLFENESKTGGGEVEGVEMDKEFGMAIITFKENEVAERVLARESLSFKDLHLILQPHRESSTGTVMEGAVGGSSPGHRAEKQVKQAKFNCIEVTGLKEDISKEHIYLFFESKKSGGGEIEELTLNEETGAAIITFKDEQTTKSVLEKHSTSRLTISGTSVQIRPLDTSVFGGNLKGLGSCAIEVTGIPVNASAELLTMFFENRRHSGGDVIEEIVHSAMDGTAVITFETPDVAQRVVDKHKSRPLDYEGQQLHIRILLSKSRPTQTAGPKEANVLFLKNIPDSADAEDIRLYLERVPQCKVQESIFGISAGTALVRFVFMPVYQKFFELSCQKPLKGSMIDIETVHRSKSIEVFGSGAASNQKLTMYFEHPKSNGGEVERVDMIAEPKCAIVTFKQHGVAEQVIAKSNHCLENQTLTIGLHHECLGVIPPDHDYKTPTASLPSHITIDQYDIEIVTYILNTQSNWEYVDTGMKMTYAEVQWPRKSSTEQEIIIKCLLKKSTPDLQKLISTWSTDAKSMFEGLLLEYSTASVDTLKDAWVDFHKFVKDNIPKNMEEAVVSIHQQHCSVSIIGKKKVVDKLMEMFIQIKDQLEERLKRLKEVTSEPVSNLKPHQVKFLMAHKFPYQMKQVFSDMRVETDIKASNVTFIGVPGDIMTAKLQMYELVNQMVEEKIEISKPVGILLRQKNTRECLVSKYKEANIIIVYDAMDTEVIVYAKSKEDLAKGVAIIGNSIIERTVDIQDDSIPTLTSPNWKSLKDTMLKDYEGELIIYVSHDNRSIQVVANERVVNGVLEMIANYLKENTILKKFINMESGTQKLMTKCLKTELDAIENQFLHSSVKVQSSTNTNKPGILVQGIQTALQPAVMKVQELANQIVYMDHTINKPGMPRCFKEERGQSYLNSLESTYQVAIELNRDKRKAAADFPQGSQISLTKFKCKVTLKGGQVLFVAEGDLPTYQADAIVNAANSELKHYGGLAGAILSKGGNIIQEECTGYVERKSSLLNGEVYVSSSGRLPCKKIIHAVGPKWQGGYSNEENELYEAVYNSLEAASEHKLKSIAIPAISSGIFGFPLQKSCSTVVCSVSDYLKTERTTLEEVHLVDNAKKTVNLFYESVVKTFGQNDVENMDGRNKSQSEYHQSYRSPKFQQQVIHKQPKQPSYWNTISKNCLQSKEGVNVTLVKGAITSQQVDVIVNSTRHDLQLGSGGVSAAILAAAGSTIQTQCQQQAPGGISHGQIVVTNGGQLQCQEIYHGACPNFKNGTAISILETFVTNCLQQAHASGCSSIAFPAIGTGNLGYPRPLVAMHMFEEIKKFSQANMGTTLTDIRFIIFDQDVPTLLAFEAEMERLKSGGNSQKETVHRVLVKTNASYGSDDDNDWEHIPRQETKSVPTSGQIEVSQLRMKNCNVTVVKGDITCDKVDVIVNSTNKQLNFGSQVSRAILNRGGAEIARECVQIGQVDSNDIAVTLAGDLPCRHIIHVAAPSDPDAFRYTSKWKTRVNNILEKGNKLRCSSISFPALGTGILHTNPSKMAAAMFDAFYEYQEKQPTHLRNIRVVVYEEQMLDTFVDILQKMDEKKKGFLQMLSGKLQEFGQYITGSGSLESDARPKRRRSSRKETIDVASNVHSSEMVFHLYGLKQSIIDQVAKRIDNFCDQESQDRILDSPKDQETIEKLSSKQISYIESLQKKHDVVVTIRRGPRINRIRIQGQNLSITSVMEEIWKMFREVDAEEREKQEAELISKQVQWQFETNTKFQSYPPEINLIIEKAYQKKDTKVRWKEKKYQGPGQKQLCVIFAKNVEIEEGNPAAEVRVRRFTQDNVEVPTGWSSMNAGDTYIMVDLQQGTPEYSTVEQKFVQDLQQSAHNGIIKIQRLQNPSMYKKYIVHKIHLNAANPAGTINEKQLWHGTSANTLAEIHTSGFNRSFCGKNGTAHGKGVYFATYASLSNGYASPDTNGYRHMYLCKVLVGVPCKSHPSYLVPPAKDPNKPSIKYDSVMDNIANPQIIVIFSDTQSYPEYLITYY